MRAKPTVCVLFLTVCYLGCTADCGAHAQQPAAGTLATRIERTITYEPIVEQEIVRVPLDAAVYAQAFSDRRDVRILNRKGEEAPFLMRRQVSVAEREVEKSWTVNDLQLQPVRDEGLIIRFKLGKNEPQPEGLRIITPLKDFEQTVRLVAIDGSEEVTLVDSALLFDYSKYMNLRRTEIEFPATTAREFRLIVSSPTLEQQSAFLALTKELQAGGEISRRESITVERRPFRIDRIELFTIIKAFDEVTAEYPIEVSEPRQDLERKETRFELTLGRVPLQRIEVETSSVNFSRQSRVLAPEYGGLFTQIVGSAQLIRLEFRDLRDEHLAIPIHSEPVEKLELVIENRDSPPLIISDVHGFGHVNEAVFFASPDEEYRLIYAGAQDKLPDYDTAALSSLLKEDVASVIATLGPPQQVTATVVPQPWKFADLLDQPWIIAAIITLLVAILGFLLYGAAKRIDPVTQDASEP